jgi:3-hydroxyisobutyrate dehydrogenase
MRAGFIGLGAMGTPMAVNLHKAGLLGSIWNRTAGKAASLAAELGCHHADNPGELGAISDVVVLCVSGDEDVLEMADAVAPQLAAGAVVVDCSTVSARTAREACRRLNLAGAGFLDCPVSGGTEGARAGSLSIMVGGDPSDLDRARPVLEAMGRTIVHMGPVGAGQATKATNQIMVAGINQAVTEALAFAAACELPMDSLITALSGGAAGNWFLSHRGPTMVRGEYPLGFKVALHQKDLGICADMAAGFGVRLPVVEMTRHHYSRLMDEDHGDEDISSLFRIKSAMFRDGGG